MKKLWALSISTALLVGVLAFAPKAKATFADDPSADAAALAGLLTGRIQESKYTKKTAIYLTAEAAEENRKNFHAGTTQLKRTTYYDESDNGRLLMGDYDGGFDEINSGYISYKDENNCYHFRYNHGGNPTEDNIFTSISNKENWLPGRTTNTYYVTLSSLAAWVTENYTGNWTRSGDAFIHEIPDGGLIAGADGYYADKTLHYFQCFAAPMLLDKVKEFSFLTPTRIVVQNATNFLSIRIFTSPTDEGKLELKGVTDASDMLLSEARVYGGIHFNPGPNYNVRGTFNEWGEEGSIKFNYLPDVNLPEQYEAVCEFEQGTEFKIFGGAAAEGAGNIEEGSWTWVKGDTSSNSNIEVKADATYHLYWKPGQTKQLAIAVNDITKVRHYFVDLPSWVWNAEAKLFASVWSTTASRWVELTKLNDNVAYTEEDISDLELTGALLVRTHKDTVTPNWAEGDDVAGRIYNQTQDVNPFALNMTEVSLPESKWFSR